MSPKTHIYPYFYAPYEVLIAMLPRYSSYVPVLIIGGRMKGGGK